MIMSDTAIVASYNPLHPVFPQSGETLVAQGSSVQVLLYYILGILIGIYIIIIRLKCL